MKLLAILLVFGFSQQWEPNFDHAKETAKSQHKLILLNFSGSDWCGPCILLRKEYLESEVFTTMANDELILVNADFPRKKKNIASAEVVKQNEALAEIYNKDGAFPFTLLLDADGNVLKTWAGKPGESPADWTARIKTVCDARKN